MNSLPELPKLPETSAPVIVPIVPPGMQMKTETTTTIKPAIKPEGNNTAFLILSAILIIGIGVLVGYLTLSYFNLVNQTVNQTPLYRATPNSYGTKPVSTTNSNTTNPLIIYGLQEFKSANGTTVWSFEVPTTFKATTAAPSPEGNLKMSGAVNGGLYTLDLSFPVFDPSKTPSSLATWVDQDMSFLTLSDASQVERKNFKIQTTVDAAILLNYPEVTSSTGTTKEFGTTKTAILYIWKTATRNQSQILLTADNYDKDTASAILNHIAETIKL